MDYYSVLEISVNADARDIRRAYLTAMKRRHPDLGIAEPGKPDAATIGAAYACLHDPARRAAYDAARERGHTSSALVVAYSAQPRRRKRRRLVKGARWRSSGASIRRWSMAALPAAFALGGVAVWLFMHQIDPSTTARPRPVSTLVTQDMLADVRMALEDSDYIAAQGDAARLVDYSSTCFADATIDQTARRGKSMSTLDFCMAFDAAAATQPLAPKAFFNARARLMRARAASLEDNEATTRRWRFIETAVNRVAVEGNRIIAP